MARIFVNKHVSLINSDCELVRDSMENAECVVLDPPFDCWDSVKPWPNRTKICFTNFQNRHHIEKLFGKPRFELVWFFRDGRWVSHSLPRITHESILIYGPTGSAYVGPKTDSQKPQKKGFGCVGRDKLDLRTYVPRERKMLNSVLEYPRNVRGALGCWGKPIELIKDLLAWSGAQTIADPYCGSGAVCIAAMQLGLTTTASEIKTETYDIAAEQIAKAETLICN